MCQIVILRIFSAQIGVGVFRDDFKTVGKLRVAAFKWCNFQRLRLLWNSFGEENISWVHFFVFVICVFLQQNAANYGIYMIFCYDLVPSPAGRSRRPKGGGL